MSTELTAGEFARRQEAAARAAAVAGLDGLLVCSRGGGAVDRYADVMYLTNFYTPFPFIPDREPDWSARAHAFVVLPAEGAAVLVADVSVGTGDDVAGGDVPIDEVVVASDMIAAVAGALKSRGLATGRIGVVGADALPWSVHRKLAALLPGIEWEPADALLGDLRAVKSAGEIDRLEAASKLGSRAIDAMLDAAAPGTTHGEVMLAGMEVMVPAGALHYNSFMRSGTGGNAPTFVASRFPTYGADQPLADGQWFHVGISGVLDGYYFDLARSTPIGAPTAEQIRAFEAAVACVEAGIAAVRPGAVAADVARAGARTLEELGFDMGGAFSGFGHGIGLGWDSPWLIPGDETPLVPGMVLCIERTVRLQGYSGDFEETVVVTGEGARRITDARIRRW